MRDTLSANSIGMLRCAPSTSDPQLGADGHVPVIGGRSGNPDSTKETVR